MLQHHHKLSKPSGAASYWLCEGRGPAVHRGEWTDGGMVRRRDGEMVSCHLTEPNYKTTQHCAHSWGARPPVTRGKIDDVSVTCRVETHPDITALLSAHVKEGNTGPRDTTLRDTHHTCPHMQRYSNICVCVCVRACKPHPPVGPEL